MTSVPPPSDPPETGETGDRPERSVSDGASPPEPVTTATAELPALDAPSVEAADAPPPAGPEPHGTPEFLAALTSLLADGPLTAFGLTQACERTWPGFLEGRQGFVHAALIQLRRRGDVASAWALTAAGSRRVFARTTDALVGLASEPGQAGEAPRILRDAATQMVRGLAFAPQLQADAHRDLLDHLVDLTRAVELTAERVDESTRAALRDFGDPWRIRTDLRRAAQGRRTVLFPRGARETLAGLAIYDATILLAIIGAIVFVRLQMLTAYHIPTRSMEPTLHGDRRDGDRILVNRLSGPPERFDPYVFGGWGAERKNYVKRCVGLPNETLLLREGDVYIDGELFRKDGDTYEALLFRLYHWDDIWARALADNPDSREAAHEQAFDEQMDLWENVVGKWELHTRLGYQASAPPGDEEFVLRWQDTVHDDLYTPESGNYESGVYVCPDLRVAADLTLIDADAVVAMRLSRGAATYDAVLGADRIVVQADGEDVIETDVPGVPIGSAKRVLFSSVDRVLRLEIDGRVWRHDLPQPEFPKRSAQASVVEFRVRGGAATVKPVSLERDVFYTPDYDTDDEVTLGPNDFFMLGDNSGNSQDSRRNGPVHRQRLVGKPILIVWPPARWRDPSTAPYAAPR